MPIMVNCTCGNVMSVEDQFAGKTVVCNQCQRVTSVPAVGPAAAPAADPAGGTPNPYLEQNAGYAAAASVQGYSHAPQQYYTPQQVGADRPGRGLLITGGVLGIISSVLFGGFLGLVLVVADGASGSFSEMSDRSQAYMAVFGLATVLALAGIVTAALAFGARTWAVIATAGVQVGLTALAAYLGNAAPSKVSGVFWFFAILAGLAAVFLFLGVGQAKKYRAWKGVG
jgi:hypothetical protein